MKTWHWGNVSRPGRILEISWLQLTGVQLGGSESLAVSSPDVTNGIKTVVMWRTTEVWYCLGWVYGGFKLVETFDLRLRSWTSPLARRANSGSRRSSRRGVSGCLCGAGYGFVFGEWSSSPVPWIQEESPALAPSSGQSGRSWLGRDGLVGLPVPKDKALRCLKEVEFD